MSKVSNKAKKPLSLKSLLLANPWGFVIPVALGIIASLAGVALLGISGWFITAAGLATAMGVSLFFNYLTPGAIVRLMAILRTVGRYGEQVTAHNHLLSLLRILRLWVWDQRVAQDPANLHKQSRGDLLQRLVSDLDHIIRWPLVVFLPWVYALLGYIGVTLLAYFILPDLVWPMVVVAVLQLIILPYVCGRFASHAVHVGQILGVHRRSRFISVFSALITLTIRGHWKDYSERLTQLDERQKRMEIRIQNAISLGRLIAYSLTIGLLAICFYLLGEMSHDGTGKWQLLNGVQGTWVVALVLSLLAVNELVLPLVQAFVAQGQSQVGLRRLNQLHQEITEQPLETPETIQSIELNHWRGYHAPSNMGNPAINYRFEAGDKVWIRGTSGSGKSTLLASLAGDCLATGEAHINDMANQPSVALYGNTAYQTQLSYLPQSPYIFQQSVAANLLLGDANATDQQLWHVLDAVALGDWARNLPNQLSTLLSAQGRDLSGGQRKRLALARLLLRKAPILLLDEPFDGLDKQTIERICKALEGEYQPSLLVFVSHVGVRLGEGAKVIEL